ncbi:hypothetical protein DFJ73DRAFT_41133 [Zopfochytrium polystomum]|nr:hypothetical protein DFJ73DRAFT_41133 [Zopfochytrium polystomum]
MVGDVDDVVVQQNPSGGSADAAAAAATGTTASVTSTTTTTVTTTTTTGKEDTVLESSPIASQSSTPLLLSAVKSLDADALAQAVETARAFNSSAADRRLSAELERAGVSSFGTLSDEYVIVGPGTEHLPASVERSLLGQTVQEETVTTTQAVDSIIVTLTHEVVNAETDEVLDTHVYTLEIPGYALNGWWTRTVTAVSSRYTSFSIVSLLRFIAGLQETIFVDDAADADAILLSIFRAAIEGDAAASLSESDLTAFKNAVDPHDSGLLWRLFVFVRKTIILVEGNVDLVVEQVLPLFDYSTSQTTTTTITSADGVEESDVNRELVVEESIEETELENSGGIVVTLTKQTLDSESNEVLETTDYTLEIPGYALYGWWLRFIAVVTTRYAHFSIITFFSYLGECNSLANDADICAALKAGGADVSIEELPLFRESVETPAGLNQKDPEQLLLLLLVFIRSAVRLVGAELVIEQVLPLLDYNLKLAEEEAAAAVTSEPEDLAIVEVSEGGSSDSIVVVGSEAVIAQEMSKEVIVPEATAATSTTTTTTTTEQTIEIVTGAIITLTKQTVDPATGSVLESTDYSVEIPGYALTKWWLLFSSTILARYTSFSVTAFLTALGDSDNDVTDADILHALDKAGAGCTDSELKLISQEVGLAEPGLLVRLFTFVRRTVRLVGVELVESQVLPLLASAEEQASGTADADTAKTVEETETRTTSETVVIPAVDSTKELGLISSETVVTAPAATTTMTTETHQTVEVVTGAIVTLTKQELNPDTREVINSTEYSVEIPGYALTKWWLTLTRILTTRFTAFNITRFLTLIGESDEVTDASLESALAASGAPCSAAELEDIKREAGITEPGLLVRLFVFIHSTIRLVGVELVETQVLPLLASGEEQAEVAPVEAITTSVAVSGTMPETTQATTLEKGGAVDVPFAVQETTIVTESTEVVKGATPIPFDDAATKTVTITEELPVATTSSTTTTTTETVRETVEVVTGAIITLTKQVINPDTNEVLESFDFNVEIPGFALTRWWRRFLTVLTTRYTTFNVSRFLTLIGESEEVTDASIIAALADSGAVCSIDELESIKKEAGVTEIGLLVRLFSFIRSTIKLVGVELVETQVLPLLETGEQSVETVEVSAPVESTATTSIQAVVTTETEDVAAQEIPASSHVVETVTTITTTSVDETLASHPTSHANLPESASETKEVIEIVDAPTAVKSAELIISTSEVRVETALAPVDTVLLEAAKYLPAVASESTVSYEATEVETEPIAEKFTEAAQESVKSEFISESVPAEVKFAEEKVVVVADSETQPQVQESVTIVEETPAAVESIQTSTTTTTITETITSAPEYQPETTYAAVPPSEEAKEVVIVEQESAALELGECVPTTAIEQSVVSSETVVDSQEIPATTTTTTTTTTETVATVEEVTGAVVTLTKQTINPETNEVLESTEVNVEIPGYALTRWWNRLITIITSRFTKFNVTRFLTLIGESDEVTDASLHAALSESGASCTADELESIKSEAGVAESGLLVRLFSFIHTTVKLVGVELTETQVLPLLASGEESVEVAAPAETVTTVTTSEQVVVAPAVTETVYTASVPEEAVAVVETKEVVLEEAPAAVDSFKTEETVTTTTTTTTVIESAEVVPAQNETATVVVVEESLPTVETKEVAVVEESIAPTTVVETSSSTVTVTETSGPSATPTQTVPIATESTITTTVVEETVPETKEVIVLEEAVSVPAVESTTTVVETIEMIKTTESEARAAVPAVEEVKVAVAEETAPVSEVKDSVIVEESAASVPAVESTTVIETVETITTVESEAPAVDVVEEVLLVPEPKEIVVVEESSVPQQTVETLETTTTTTTTVVETSFGPVEHIVDTVEVTPSVEPVITTVEETVTVPAVQEVLTTAIADAPVVETKEVTVFEAVPVEFTETTTTTTTTTTTVDENTVPAAAEDIAVQESVEVVLSETPAIESKQVVVGESTVPAESVETVETITTVSTTTVDTVSAPVVVESSETVTVVEQVAAPAAVEYTTTKEEPAPEIVTKTVVEEVATEVAVPSEAVSTIQETVVVESESAPIITEKTETVMVTEDIVIPESSTLTTTTTTETVEETVEVVTGAVVTVTKQTINPDTNEVLESTDYSIEIPGFALTSWWDRLCAVLVSRFSAFNITRFLTLIGELDEVTDASLSEAISKYDGSCTAEELESIKSEAGLSEPGLFVRLMMFVCTTIKLVGVDLVATQVLPLLASGEESTTVESVVEAVPTQAVTTVVTEEVIPAVSKDSYSTEASSVEAAPVVKTSEVIVDKSHVVETVPTETMSIVAMTEEVPPAVVEETTSVVESSTVVVTVVEKSEVLVGEETAAPAVEEESLTATTTTTVSQVTEAPTIETKEIVEKTTLTEEILEVPVIEAKEIVTVVDNAPAIEEVVAPGQQTVETTVTETAIATTEDMPLTKDASVSEDTLPSTTVSVIESSNQSGEVVTGAVITLTKQVINPDTDEVLDSTEYNVEIPEFALNSWYKKLLAIITSRYSTFNTTKFLTLIGESEDVSDASLNAALVESGVSCSAEELAVIKSEAGLSEPGLLSRLFSFIQKTIKLVGVELVETQVLPLLASGDETVEAAVSSDVSLAKEETVVVTETSEVIADKPPETVAVVESTQSIEVITANPTSVAKVAEPVYQPPVQQEAPKRKSFFTKMFETGQSIVSGAFPIARRTSSGRVTPSGRTSVEPTEVIVQETTVTTTTDAVVEKTAVEVEAVVETAVIVAEPVAETEQTVETVTIVEEVRSAVEVPVQLIETATAETTVTEDQVVVIPETGAVSTVPEIEDIAEKDTVVETVPEAIESSVTVITEVKGSAVEPIVEKTVVEESIVVDTVTATEPIADVVEIADSTEERAVIDSTETVETATTTITTSTEVVETAVNLSEPVNAEEVFERSKETDAIAAAESVETIVFSEEIPSGTISSSTTETVEQTVETVTGAVVTLTKQTFNPDTNEVLESTEVNVEIPGFALTSWWKKLLTILTTRYSTFNTTQFLTRIGNAEDINDASLTEAITAECGDSCTAEDVESFKAEAGLAEAGLLTRLFGFIHTTIQLVGVSLVETQILPLLETSENSVEAVNEVIPIETSQTVETVTTTSETAAEIVSLEAPVAKESSYVHVPEASVVEISPAAIESVETITTTTAVTEEIASAQPAVEVSKAEVLEVLPSVATVVETKEYVVETAAPVEVLESTTTTISTTETILDTPMITEVTEKVVEVVKAPEVAQEKIVVDVITTTSIVQPETIAPVTAETSVITTEESTSVTTVPETTIDSTKEKLYTPPAQTEEVSNKRKSFFSKMFEAGQTIVSGAFPLSRRTSSGSGSQQSTPASGPSELVTVSEETVTTITSGHEEPVPVVHKEESVFQVVVEAAPIATVAAETSSTTVVTDTRSESAPATTVEAVEVLPVLEVVEKAEEVEAPLASKLAETSTTVTTVTTITTEVDNENASPAAVAEVVEIPPPTIEFVETTEQIPFETTSTTVTTTTETVDTVAPISVAETVVEEITSKNSVAETIVVESVEPAVIMSETVAVSEEVPATSYTETKTTTTTTETKETVEEVTGAVITLTKQTINPETNEVLESTEVNVEIPEYALTHWWSRLITIITSQFTNFNVTRFLTLIGESDEVTDASLHAALSESGVSCTADKLESIKSEAGVAESGLLVRLFSFIRTTVKLVGVELTETQVLPLLASGEESVEVVPPAESVTTTVTSEQVVVAPAVTETLYTTSVPEEAVAVVESNVVVVEESPVAVDSMKTEETVTTTTTTTVIESSEVVPAQNESTTVTVVEESLPTAEAKEVVVVEESNAPATVVESSTTVTVIETSEPAATLTEMHPIATETTITTSVVEETVPEVKEVIVVEEAVSVPAVESTTTVVKTVETIKTTDSEAPATVPVVDEVTVAIAEETVPVTEVKVKETAVVEESADSVPPVESTTTVIETVETITTVESEAPAVEVVEEVLLVPETKEIVVVEESSVLQQTVETLETTSTTTTTVVETSSGPVENIVDTVEVTPSVEPVITTIEETVTVSAVQEVSTTAIADVPVGETKEVTVIESVPVEFTEATTTSTTSTTIVEENAVPAAAEDIAVQELVEVVPNETPAIESKQVVVAESVNETPVAEPKQIVLEESPIPSETVETVQSTTTTTVVESVAVPAILESSETVTVISDVVPASQEIVVQEPAEVALTEIPVIEYKQVFTENTEEPTRAEYQETTTTVTTTVVETREQAAEPAPVLIERSESTVVSEETPAVIHTVDSTVSDTIAAETLVVNEEVAPAAITVETTEETTEVVSGAVITLTKQTIVPETNEVLESVDYSVEIPGYALTSWWRELIKVLSTRYTTFNTTRFLALIGESPEVSDEVLAAAISESGGVCGAEELDSIKAEARLSESGLLVRLFTFIRTTIKLVGVELVETQVLPLLASEETAVVEPVEVVKTIATEQVSIPSIVVQDVTTVETKEVTTPMFETVGTIETVVVETKVEETVSISPTKDEVQEAAVVDQATNVATHVVETTINQSTETVVDSSSTVQEQEVPSGEVLVVEESAIPVATIVETKEIPPAAESLATVSVEEERGTFVVETVPTAVEHTSKYVTESGIILPEVVKEISIIQETTEVVESSTEEMQPTIEASSAPVEPIQLVADYVKDVAAAPIETVTEVTSSAPAEVETIVIEEKNSTETVLTESVAPVVVTESSTTTTTTIVTTEENVPSTDAVVAEKKVIEVEAVDVPVVEEVTTQHTTVVETRSEAVDLPAPSTTLEAVVKETFAEHSETSVAETGKCAFLFPAFANPFCSCRSCCRVNFDNNHHHRDYS